MVQGMTLGNPRSDMVLWLKVQGYVFHTNSLGITQKRLNPEYLNLVKIRVRVKVQQFGMGSNSMSAL